MKARRKVLVMGKPKTSKIFSAGIEIFGSSIPSREISTFRFSNIFELLDFKAEILNKF